MTTLFRSVPVWVATTCLFISVGKCAAIELPSTGQVLHFDASDTGSITFDGSNVASWADLSTSGNNASQSNGSLRPAYATGAMNGLPVVRYDGSGNYLELDSTMNLFSGMDVFIVGQNFNGGDPIANGWQNSSGGGGFRIQSNNGGNLSAQFGGPTAPIAVLTTTVSSPYSDIIGVTYNDTSDDYFLRRTGDLANSITSGGNYNTNSSHSSKIGISNNNSGGLIFPLDGDIAEIVVYDQVLSESDRQFVEGYLAYKWGLQSQLPVDHAYFNSSFFSAPVPEPSTMLLLVTMLAMALPRGRKRAKSAQLG